MNTETANKKKENRENYWLRITWRDVQLMAGIMMVAALVGLAIDVYLWKDANPAMSIALLAVGMCLVNIAEFARRDALEKQGNDN